MKKDIHPKYTHKRKVTCISCGFTFVTGSTAEEDISVEICSHCHPFYTGVDRVVDTENLIKKYEERQKKAEAKAKSFKSLKKKQEKAKKVKQETPTKELTLKDMLAQLNS